MAISSELLSSFAKIVAPKETRPEFTVVTGRAKSYAGKMYVQIDGSDQLTPIASSTVGIKDNDWVTVQIKNHSATVTGNATDPSAGTSYADDIKNQVDDVVDQISEFEIVIADKVSTTEFDAQVGRIDDLVSDNVTIKEKLTATEAEIGSLTADNVTINEKLTAAEADIENLTVTKIDVDIADAKYATIANLEATNADIHNLEADYGDFKVLATDKLEAADASIQRLDAEKLSATDAELKFANIDFANIGTAAIENFFSKSGMIGDLVVGDGTITGTLVGVTIKGDLIEGGTVKADKLVVQGEDGLYYKLNVTGETVSAEQTEYNSLNGSIITAKSITAEKISVNDLVAFGATIGGFHITEDSLYSGAKNSADNTTRGTFMNDDGEFAIGDGSNYLKFYKDTDGTYKLAISASAIKFGANGTSIEDLANTAKLTDTEKGYIAEIGPNAGKPPISVTLYGEKGANPTGIVISSTKDAADGVTLPLDMQGYALSATDDAKDELHIDSDGNVTLVQNTEEGSPVVDLGTVVLPNLNKDQAYAWAVSDIPCEIDVEYWTTLGETVADIKEETDNAVGNVEATVTIQNDRITTLEQDQNGWAFNFDQIKTEITQLGNDITTNYESQLKYIKFIDGEIWLGRDPDVGEDDFKVVISNEKIRFLQNNTEIAYISNNKLYITDATIQRRLDLGNFAFIPRTNGNLSFKFTG